MADKNREPLDGRPFFDKTSFIFSYDPSRTSEYDIWRMKAAESPVYKLLKPVFATVRRSTENMEGLWP